jgi:hypothetical protein
MSLTIHDRMVRAALNGALSELNAGSADATGDVRLLTSGDAELAQLNFSNPAFASSSTPGVGVAEAATNAIAQDSTVTNGTFTKVQWRDRDNVVLIAGSVGLPGSGADLIVTDNVIPPTASAVVSPGLTAALILIG